MKRAIDVAVASVLLVLLAPVFVAVAAAVRLTSAGPVIYRQTRIGRDGRPFAFWKFRSMYADADAQRNDLEAHNEAVGPIFKIRDDPRVTPVGYWLRRLSLDELPQLCHVWSGKMSLVGPRPHLPDEVAAYGDRERRRLYVKPGITCIREVSGRSELEFDAWIDLDLRYIDEWSLGLDLKIMAKTIPAVLTGRGAY